MSSWVQQPRQALKSASHSPSSGALTPASFFPSLKPRGNYIDASNRAGHSTVVFSAHFWPLMSLCITHCRQNREIFLLTKWPTERHGHAKFLHSSSELQSLSMKDLISQLKIILLTYVWDLIHRINTLSSKLSKTVSPPLVFTLSSAVLNCRRKHFLCFKDWFAPIVNHMQMNAFRQAYKLHWLSSEQSSLRGEFLDCCLSMPPYLRAENYCYKMLSVWILEIGYLDLLLIWPWNPQKTRHRMCPKYLSHHACYFYRLCG